MKGFSENVIDTQALCLRIHALAQQNPLVAAIAAQGTEVVEMLLRKNLDYGSSVFSSPILSGDLTPEKALKVRMSDKIARMQSLDQSGKAHIASESYSDTVRDLAGYCILWLAVLASKQPGETSVAGKASTGPVRSSEGKAVDIIAETMREATPAEPVPLDPPTAEAAPKAKARTYLGGWTRHLGECGSPAMLPVGLVAAWIEAQQRNTLARSTASHAEGNDQTRLTSMAFAEGWDSAMEYLVSQLVSSPACDSLNALDLFDNLPRV